MTEANPISDVARTGAAATNMWGIALVILGILCIALPFVAGALATVLIAVAIIAAGIVTMVGAFRADSWGIGIFAFLMGVAAIIAGVVLLGRPMLGMVSIALALAAYFVVDGVFQIIGAFKARPAKGWGWFLFGGIISIVLGYIIYSDWPVSGFWVIGMLVGIRMIFGGWTMMMVGVVEDAIADELETP